MAAVPQTSLSTSDFSAFLVDDTLLKSLSAEPMYPTKEQDSFTPVQIQGNAITAEVYGGKAASLGKLIRQWASVPTAFAIPCEMTFKRPKIDTSGIKHLFRHHGPMPTFAVRSGAPTSMPGLMTTKLNVKLEDLQQAVEAVWDSWDSEHAKLYRQAKGIENTGTGVIIQHWIDSEVAGVAFTNDPNNVDYPDEYNPVVEFVKGQGEQLVSGSVQPTRATGKELWYNELNNWLEALHNEWGPSDIEWCYHEGNLYLLQWRKLKFADIAPTYPLEDDAQGRELIKKGKPIGSPKRATLDICTNSSKFKDGDALLVEEFSPEYYPLMMRAGAILCAAGGETCHAAIIAREVGIIAISGIMPVHLDGVKKAVVSGVTGAIYKANDDEQVDVVQVEVKSNNPPLKPNMALVNMPWQANALIVRFYHTLDKHKNGALSVEERDAVVREIAQIFSSYFYTIALCEMRHFPHNNYGVNANKPIIKEFQRRGVKIPELVNPDRSEFKNEGIPQPGSLKRAIELMELCVEGYTDYTWSSKYGGQKWAKIAQMELSYLKGDLSDLLFIDACFNLQHNCGSVFGKFGKQSLYAIDGLKPQLDAKVKSFDKLLQVSNLYPNIAYYVDKYAARERLLEQGSLEFPDVDEPLLDEPALWAGDINIKKHKEKEAKAYLASKKAAAGSSISNAANTFYCDCPTCTESSVNIEPEEEELFDEDEEE